MEKKSKLDEGCCGKHNEKVEKMLTKTAKKYSDNKAHVSKTPHQEFLEQKAKEKSSKFYSR